MRQFNMHEAKTHLSRLADDAGKGETIILAKAGKPIAKLVPIDADVQALPRRKLGGLEGKFTVPDDFDTMFEDEIVAMFEGEE